MASGCVSRAMYADLRARDAARAARTNPFKVRSVLKSGKVGRSDYGQFRTRAEAEARAADLARMNAGKRWTVIEG